MEDLIEETLSALLRLSKAASSHDGFLTAELAPGRDRDYYSVTEEGDLVLLIGQTSAATSFSAVSSSAALSVVPAQKYILRTENRDLEATFLGLVLRKSHRHLSTSFGYLAASLLTALPGQPTINELDKFLCLFTELFERSEGIELNTVKGLWGELWVLSEAPDTFQWFDAWHAEESALFDFSFASGNVEVKTHAGWVPAHRFSHQQLSVASDSTWVCSVLLVDDPDGASVIELLSSLCARLDAARSASLVERCLRILGASVEQADSYRWRFAGDRQKCCIAVRDMPKLQVAHAPEISGISYNIDLSSALSLYGRSNTGVITAVE